jgi:hypothetical protein
MSQGRACEHLCHGRNCLNPKTRENLWKYGSGGSHKTHMQSRKMHPNCSSTCPAFLHIAGLSTAVQQTVHPPNISDLACTWNGQQPYCLLVVFSVEHRLDKLLDPDAPSTNWTRTEFPLTEANRLLHDTSIAGFVSGPLHKVRQGVVLVRIHDRVDCHEHPTSTIHA